VALAVVPVSEETKEEFVVVACAMEMTKVLSIEAVFARTFSSHISTCHEVAPIRGKPIV
jgi:hypothetical protein